MLIYGYVIITCLLPFPVLWYAHKQKNRFTYNWWATLLLFLIILLLIYQAGAWPYIGFNWRFFILLLYLGVFILFTLKSKNKKSTEHASIASSVILSILVLLFAGTNIEIYLGGSTTQQPISLVFPLHNGKYTIMQGGDSEIGNLVHRYNTPNSYAIDIVKLNENNKRGSKLFSKNLDAYAIYGDTIYSPCSGTIITCYDGVEENIPPATNTKIRGGNHVVIRNGDIKILICHMQKNSIAVQKGTSVKTGDVIGLVGNSGFSIEPHLHIQAYTTQRNVNMMVPITFEGKFLNINDCVVPAN